MFLKIIQCLWRANGQSS